jgi:hypothetical protein
LKTVTGLIVTSFLTNRNLYREVADVKVCPQQKTAFKLRLNPGLRRFGSQWRETNKKPIRRVLVRDETITSADLETLSLEIQKCFEALGRRLVIVSLDLDGSRKTWKNMSILEKFGEFERTEAVLKTEMDNGARPAVIRFYEKMLRMDSFDVASSLGIDVGSAAEMLPSIKREFANFA